MFAPSDNLKAGITKASFHEPMVTRTYAERSADADKAKVEFSLADL
jgi:hypothetical protein